MDEDVYPGIEVYWVERSRLMAGEYPLTFRKQDTRHRLRWLLDRGITGFLDLTEEGEAGLPDYRGDLQEEADLKGVMIEHIRRPIPDMGISEVQEMKETLDLIDRFLGRGINVYLHCYGGKGRTGTVVGCWLVRHGLSGEQALERISELRRDLPNRSSPSPETREQESFVRKWKAGM